jgi:hypothetical protein
VFRILQPGFFLENLDGFIGSIGVAVLKRGLKPETDVAFIVSMQLFERFGSYVDFAKGV